MRAFLSAIYRSESAKALAHAEMLLAFAPAAEAAGSGPMVARNLTACLALLAGKLEPESDSPAARNLIGKIMLRAAVGQKWSAFRAALGRAKRKPLGRNKVDA